MLIYFKKTHVDTAKLFFQTCTSLTHVKGDYDENRKKHHEDKGLKKRNKNFYKISIFREIAT